MELILSIVIGVLYTVGVFFLLRRSMIRIILGVLFLGNATNLLIFVASGVTPDAQPSFLSSSTEAASSNMADPMPQALILTAIVISFGVVAYLLTLLRKTHEITGEEDMDQLK
ncbi:NADH-quinone oxidoreductase subunit K [Carboxylicivirga linearis]|uniref:NADH-quinone oxidoreductase subunit K n=1 Tax=Carboxylicivirga linearis TaxID=1628157 RepID=A0ABS5JT58_9BACT|nr:NADH-quinone oxidoreductase subunit K [Carboxylicivirga linearis]MBS2097719.1 NADH-quinone oxidoreductase subunit K [Carboxylicivirga linearis]